MLPENGFSGTWSNPPRGTSEPSTSFLDQNNNSTSTTNCDGKDKVEVNGIESFCEVDDLIEEILLFAGNKNVSANIIHDLQCIRRDIRMYSVQKVGQ